MFKMADGDSPLSTTSNIVGILTFALATLSFCLAFYAATADAPREMRSYKGCLIQREAHIEEIGQFFNKRDVEADNELENSPLKGLVSGSLRLAEERRKELQTNVYKICGTEQMSISQRVWWWRERRDMNMATAGVDIQIQHLTSHTPEVRGCELSAYKA
ncbi:hypothetical protein F5883DRAFT_571883 [Diaporthe sp. PMI_573]|nr:hypothetical protein F5883DRAFT_571883 [Diaporthaceae sp. PMI_573]